MNRSIPSLWKYSRERSRSCAPLYDYELALQASQKNPHDSALQEKIINLSGKIDELDGWQLESDAKTILTKLGITDFSAKIKTLSGGQQKRLALATALIQPCDLLLLDEPTNHLDSETIAWLEDYLRKLKTALIMVTHDRYFLDSVATKILELDKGHSYVYTGQLHAVSRAEKSAAGTGGSFRAETPELPAQ